MDKIFKKFIVEVRYFPVYNFKENAYRHLREVSNYDLNLNVIETPDIIELIDENQYKKIFCQRNRAGILIENINDLKQLNAECDGLEKLLREMNVKSARRLGVRTIFLKVMRDKSYKDTILLMADRVLRKDNITLSPDVFEDFALIVNGKKSNFKYNTICGVVNKKEIKEKHADFIYDDPETSFLLDIDISETDLKYIINTKYMIDMYKKAEEIYDDFFKRNPEL